MAESSISGVEKKGMEVAASIPPMRSPDPANGSQKVSGVKSDAAQPSEPKGQAEPKPQSGQGTFGNVSLKFQVDEKTNQVTCIMIDRSSHKVIRTIPPDELKNFKEGDLVQLYT